MSELLKIGLTGGIGSGKTTVCNYFREIGVPVIDADIITRQLLLPDKPALIEVQKIVGNNFINNRNELDRKALRKKLFEDPQTREKIESILHPLVFDKINHEINTITYPYTIISIPLLIETNSMNKYDRILVIDLPENLQIERVCKRDKIDKSEVLRIIQVQTSRAERLKIADDIIYNDKDKASLIKQIKELHSFYLEQAKLLHNKLKYNSS